MWGWVTNEKIPFPICCRLGWSQVIKQWELPAEDQPSTSPQRRCLSYLGPNELLWQLMEKWGLWQGAAITGPQMRGLGDRGATCLWVGPLWQPGVSIQWRQVLKRMLTATSPGCQCIPPSHIKGLWWSGAWSHPVQATWEQFLFITLKSRWFFQPLVHRFWFKNIKDDKAPISEHMKYLKPQYCIQFFSKTVKEYCILLRKIRIVGVYLYGCESARRRVWTFVIKYF